MKHKFIQTLLLVLLPTLFAACGSDNNDPTDNIGGLTVSTDLKNNEVSAKGGSFFLQIKAEGKWTASSQDSWCTINNKEGNGNASTICSVSANDGDERYTVITVTSNGKSENVTITQKGGNGEEPDPDPNPSGYAGRIEIPKLKGGGMNLFYTHTSTYNGKEFITYSAEYDCTKKHTRWVAFTFDNVSNKKNTNRSDKWGNDPKIPSAYRTYDSDYKSPYNKGHLVASADRYITTEANVQTFYYSNMSPQISSFNGGIWSSMENKVRDWAKPLNASDTIYVVKGGKIDGTIADGTLIEYTGNQVAVPKNYFMAILSLKGGTSPQYKAIAFYIDQKNYSSSSISSYVISIDELEEKTGIDFFHNLPDNIENEVERSYNKSDWGL